jgi:hyperosmotically inducible protein
MPLKSTCVAGAMAFGLLLGGGVSTAFAQDQPPASDNTKVNKRDRSKAEPTADRAKDNVNDREIMQKIRKSIMDDKSLSTYAHNVKIISEHGKVTLKGPVRSEEEKKTIAEKATEVAGAGNVTDELTIKPGKTKGTS